MKIIQVINAMILNKQRITNVIKIKIEYFFLYDKKHKWSIIQGDVPDEFYLHFYPSENNMTIEQLSVFTDWESYNYITYKSHEIKTKEAIESFSELYNIVVEKTYGVDEIFDEIINS